MLLTAYEKFYEKDIVKKYHSEKEGQLGDDVYFLILFLL